MLDTLVARYAYPRARVCVLCGRNCYRFLPYRGQGHASLPSMIAAIGIVGSNLDQFECPWCGCHDRERHVFMYLVSAGILADLTGKAVVHFAPEPHLLKCILKAAPASYTPCDLLPSAAGIQRVDMLSMPFTDASVDLLIANHVLEHVSSYQLALAEVLRVLKPGGSAIIQTPFSGGLERTWEDPGIVSDIARLQAYGQEDHARLFGRDIFREFASSGLVPLVKTHRESLPEFSGSRFGVNEDEPFFLYTKAQLQEGD